MTQLNGVDLLFGADDPAQPMRTAGQGRLNGSDLLFGADEPQRPAADQGQSWGQWIKQSVQGKQDPRFKDAGTFDTGGAFAAEDYLNGGWQIDAAPFGNASDEQLTDIIKSNLGDRFVGMQKDANGYPLVTYRDPQGQQRTEYVNKPGLDWQDAGRALKGAVPFLMGGGAIGAATKGAPLVAQAAGQALGGAATSAGLDMALEGVGSEQGVDLDKAAIVGGVAGAGSVAAPLIGAAWRKLVTEPGLYNSSTGQLTAKGVEAARKAGLDPADMTPELAGSFAREFARTGNRTMAAEGAQSREFGIEKTAGEASGRADQLLREQRVRGGTYGEGPAMRMKSFDDAQQAQLGNAMVGDMPIPGAKQAVDTIPKRLAPSRTAGDYAPAELGEGVRGAMQTAQQTARDAERAAWNGVGKIEATDEALADLPAAINGALRGFELTAETTPYASRMASRLEAFMKGKAPQKVADFLEDSPVRDVDQMRRVLGGMVKDAETRTDRTAAGRIYDAYNDWIRSSADKLAMSNPEGAANLVIARGISREAKEAIQANTGTPAARILADVLENADTPEGVIRALFSDRPGSNKNGVATALQHLKTAYDKYLPADAAKAAWDDVRLAYWLRVAQGKDGKPVGVQQFTSNLDKARTSEATSFNLLFSVSERKAMTRLESAMKGIELKNLNRSWTGPSNGGLINDIVGAITRAIGFETFLGRAAANTVSKPFLYAKGQAEVGRALARQGGTVQPRLSGPAAAAAAPSSRD